MIIGTAGHVDHGKTTLVRALTGVDTDRLPEEKARGISIALGYAYSPLPNGEVLGFVDVPGHEKFLATMVAGATGIDFALLVVAADDGIMPQTREHLDILCLLGVGAGAVALTKVDAVDAARVAQVVADIVALTAATTLAASPVFAVSARSGQGVEALRAHLRAQALAHRRVTSNARFRMAVDRSFTLAGIGTIVTGTVHAGQVSLGDAVALAPGGGGGGARVRSIHAQDRPSPTGAAGQRCALNLAGLARDAVRRGDWIVAPAAGLSTHRFDGRLTVLSSQRKALRTGSAVQVHLGADHVAARIVVIDAAHEPSAVDGVQPGQSRVVQLVLQRPVAAWHGDRFIVRDAAATQTVGGGTVLDPFAPSRYRRTIERLAVLAALEADSPARRLGALIAQAPLGVDLQRFGLAANTDDLESVLSELPMRRVHAGGDDFAVGVEHWNALRDSALAALRRFHQTHPDEAGPDRARFRRMTFPRLPTPVYSALIAELCGDGCVKISGPWLHLPEHANAPTGAERALLQRLLPRIDDARFDPLWVRDLAKETGVAEATVRAALLRGAQRGEVYQVVRDLFYHPAAVQELALMVRRLHDADGEVRAITLRDAIGLGRKRTIQILEFFDRIGLLRRVGDRHLLRPDTLLNLGKTEPDPPAQLAAGVCSPAVNVPGGAARGGSQIPLEADLPAFPLTPEAVVSKRQTSVTQQT